MKKVSFFIDGFNLYHSLKDFTPDCKWLDLRKLCQHYIKDGEEIEDIYYFTALATWNQSKVSKHKDYIKMLECKKIKIIYGKFKKVSRHCNFCNNEYNTHEEKRTDVNIALKLFSDAIKDKYDTAILISADSDLIPPIQEVRDLFIDKRVGVVIPLGRQAKELKQTADFSQKIERQHLYSSLLDEIAEVRGAKITAPNKWLPIKR